MVAADVSRRSSERGRATEGRGGVWADQDRVCGGSDDAQRSDGADEVRGISYVILAYVALGAQIGLSAFIRVGGAPPNLVLLAALFVALNAPKEPALLGCFGLGLIQ